MYREPCPFGHGCVDVCTGIFFQYSFEMENFLAVLRNISPVCLLQFSLVADMPGGAYLCHKFLSEPSQSHWVMRAHQLHERGGTAL